jgi:diguanylate cyclase (GGDEF)-like protein/PAS domain S-box-containing protein
MLVNSARISRNVVENISLRFTRDLMGKEIEVANGVLRMEIEERKRAEEALRKSEALFRAVVEKSSEVLLLTDVEGEILYVSPPVTEGFGYSPANLIGKEARGLVHQDDSHTLAEAMQWVRQNPGKPKNTVVRIRHQDDSWSWVDITARNLLTEPGVGAVVSNLRDITDQRNAGEALNWKTTFLEALVASSHDGILVLDSRMQKVTQNQRFVEMWKMPRDVAEAEDEEQRLSFLMASIKNPEELYKKLLHLRSHPVDSIRGEFELKDGAVLEGFSYPVLGTDSTEQYGRIWMFRDITELRRYWDMLEDLSTMDGLTGISNRRRFDEFMDREWRRSIRQYSELSLLLIDIDYFKQFNDRYGHLQGDDCLRQIAATLSKTVRRAGDLVARYGGEEFACVLFRTGEERAVKVARKIVDEIARLAIPHESSTVAGYVTVSIGVATAVPAKGREYPELIGKADECLYAAKHQGRNRVVALHRDYGNEVRGDDKRHGSAPRRTA